MLCEFILCTDSGIVPHSIMHKLLITEFLYPHVYIAYYPISIMYRLKDKRQTTVCNESPSPCCAKRGIDLGLVARCLHSQMAILSN